MIIGLKAGHTLKGKGTGAIGIVKETDKNREVLHRLTAMLKEKNHTVINCTIDASLNDTADSVSIANKYNLDVFIDIHLNSFSLASANGVEVFSHSTSGKSHDIAVKMQNELVKEVGWYNRGKKQANFYTLKNTIAPAIYLELGFVGNQTDMSKWNTEKICMAIFKVLTGTVYAPVVTPQPPQNTNNQNCDEIHRVKVNGMQVGAYRNHDSVANVVKENLGKNIEIK